MKAVTDIIEDLKDVRENYWDSDYEIGLSQAIYLLQQMGKVKKVLKQIDDELLRGKISIDTETNIAKLNEDIEHIVLIKKVKQ